MAKYMAFVKQHYHKYRNKDLTKSAILSTLSAFNDLRPKYDKFVFSDNTRKDLLCLEGTIPVSFKGATYNIPICIWLFETHPFNPPMCYVRPTQVMMIKPSKHVDANGRVYLPYLHEWIHPNSDLIGLIQVMTIIFGENSPVYSRPVNQPPGIPQMTAPYPGSHPPSSQARRSGQHWVNLDPSMGKTFQRMQINDQLKAVEDKMQELSKKLTESEEQRQHLTGRLKTTEEERQLFRDRLNTTENKLKTLQDEKEELLQQQKEASSASVTEEETLLETLNVSQESTLAADYGRLMVNVADDLTLDSCLKLATLFRLPPTETDKLRRVSQTEMPGITLINFLQSRNIISMYDVTNLQEALLYIQLHPTNANLLVPYQSKLLASYQSKVVPFRFDGY